MNPVDHAMFCGMGGMTQLPASLQRPPVVLERMWTAHEVAGLFAVDPKTVVRWANKGHIQVVRTPGGHRRYAESHVRALFEAGGGVWRS